MAPFRNAEQKQTLSSSSGEGEGEEDASSSEGEEAELEKNKISTSVPKNSSAQKQPNTSKTRTSHPQRSSSSNSEPDSPSRPDPESKPISKTAPKRKASEASGVVEEMAKKKQLFGEDDEITILKGMIGFKSARGVEPGSDMKGFLKFVKKSLRFSGATKTQLYEKMRRLRQKYKNNVMRGEKDGKDHPVFSSAYEAKAFDLSKQIWGNVGGNGVGSGRAKVNASVRKSGSRTGSVGLRKGGEKRKVGEFCGSVGGLSLGEKIVKDGLGLISDSNKVELKGKWKKLRVEETELYSKKLGLICEQMEAVLEVMKSQGD